MWCYRRMINIKWMDRITNEEVIGRIGERRILWKSLKKRRGQMIGHTQTQARGIAYGYLGRGGGKEKGKAQIKIIRPNKMGVWDARHLERSNSWRGTETSSCVKPVLELCTQ